jgi:hypothetical protein
MKSVEIELWSLVEAGVVRLMSLALWMDSVVN